MNPGRPSRTPLEEWFAHRAGMGEGRPTREDIERHQLRLLRDTLAWARQRSPYYRGPLAGFDVSAIAARSDLERLPFTTAADLREHGARLLCVSQDEIERVVTLTTSGTTGVPKRLHFTADDQERTVEFFERCLATASVGGSDTVLILLPGATPGSAGDLIARAVERVGAKPVPHGFVEDLRETLALAQRVRPTAWVAAPVQALALARYAEEVAREPFRLKTAILTSDHIPGALSRALERACGSRVFEYFGMTEMGLGGGIECDAHCGYHLQEADFLFEIVDPLTGRDLPEGSRGEVVVTTLARRGMPLIRYRTGDLSRFLAGPCRCGAVLRRLERLTGRKDERVLPAADGDVGATLAALDEALFDVPGVIDFTASVTRDRHPTTLTLTVHSVRREDEALVRATYDALDRVPAILSACRAGVLTVNVAALRVEGRLPIRPGKRTLAELEER